MNDKNKLKSENGISYLSINCIRPSIFLLTFIISMQIFAQQDSTINNFCFHAGINSGILDNTLGPSLSFHYALRTDKVLQPESMLFFDRQSGRAFLSGQRIAESWVGIAAGIRINILPQRSWNPSFIIMPGVNYHIDRINSNLYFAFSNAFGKNHMISLGLNAGEQAMDIVFLKYGLWF